MDRWRGELKRPKKKRKESGTVSKEKERLVEEMNDVEASRDKCKWSKAFRGGWMESGNQIKKRVGGWGVGCSQEGQSEGKRRGLQKKEEQKDEEWGKIVAGKDGRRGTVR